MKLLFSYFRCILCAMVTKHRKFIISQKRKRRRTVAAVSLLVALSVSLGIIMATLGACSGQPQPTRSAGFTAAAGNTAAALTATPTATAQTPAGSTPAPTLSPSPDSIPANARFTGSLEALSAVVVDGDGHVLFDKQAGEKRYPASTTKILTALLVLENCELDDTVRVGAEADIPPPDSSTANLQYGEKLTVRQLLYALLIPSGNDAAYVLAVHAGRMASGDESMAAAGAVEKFVELMNARAKELGAKDSHFANPDGYQDANHYTTARDMALIALKAMEFEEFRKIVTTKQYKLPDYTVKDKNGKPEKKPRLFNNTNELLQNDNKWGVGNCSGIKTGHTSDAGYCLVSSVDRDGKRVFSVVMGSTDPGVWRDSAALLNWGLEYR